MEEPHIRKIADTMAENGYAALRVDLYKDILPDLRKRFIPYWTDHVRGNFPKYVVTLDEFDMSLNGIKHRNIRDFLIQEEWNWLHLWNFLFFQL